MNTPWGKAQEVIKYDRGFMQVTTGGHGGLMIAKGFAHKKLTPAAIKRAEVYGSYYCYEEDCLFAIPCLELLIGYGDKLLPNLTFGERLNYLIKTISYWNADYLLERNIEPDPEAYAHYQVRQETARLRLIRSPDLIVSAINLDGLTVRVTTADRETHHVTAESYKSNFNKLDLLSNCTLSEFPPN